MFMCAYLPSIFLKKTIIKKKRLLSLDRHGEMGRVGGRRKEIWIEERKRRNGIYYLYSFSILCSKYKLEQQCKKRKLKEYKYGRNKSNKSYL